MKVYYAHPMVAYGTRREQEELEIIRLRAPDAKVVNPARYSGDPGKTHEHMEFYHGLVDECDVVVYSDVGGEFVSAGVGEEVDYALEKGKPVYRIDHKTRKLVRVHGEAKHLSRAGTRLLYRTMKWSGLRGEDLHKIVRMKIAEFGGRLSEEDALLMVAADLGVNTKTFLNNALKEAPEKIKAEKSEKPNYRDAETLRRLYEKEKLSTYKCAEKLGVSHQTVWKWLKKQEIETRSISEAHEIYPKEKFLRNPIKKAFRLGLRAGDIHARKFSKAGNVIQVSITTTHPAMREFMRNEFGRYGHYYECPVFNKKTNQYGFYVACNLDGESSDFLLEKPTEAPKGDLFWAFLAGYAICEGNWNISETHGYKRTRFQLQTTDYDLLRQIKERSEEEGFHPKFRLVTKAGGEREGGFRYTKHYYGVFWERGGEVVALVEKLLPYTPASHWEKVEWMKLIIETKNEKYWTNVKDKVIAFREKIGRETEKGKKEFEEKYKESHGGKDWYEVHSQPKPQK